MGNCEKYVHDNVQIFTHIMRLNVKKMCQILTIGLTANKGYGPKTGQQEEPWEDYSNSCMWL